MIRWNCDICGKDIGTAGSAFVFKNHYAPICIHVYTEKANPRIEDGGKRIKELELVVCDECEDLFSTFEEVIENLKALRSQGRPFISEEKRIKQVKPKVIVSKKGGARKEELIEALFSSVEALKNKFMTTYSGRGRVSGGFPKDDEIILSFNGILRDLNMLRYGDMEG